MEDVGALLSADGTYFVILGDFGRRASTRLASLVEELECDLLVKLLGHHDHPFYDEYRCISFTLFGNVRALKSDMIADFLNRGEALDDRILVGVNSAPIPEKLLDKMVELCAREVVAAIKYGFRRIRVCMPCNTLSLAAQQVVDQVAQKPMVQETILRMEHGLRVSIKAVPIATANVEMLLNDEIVLSDGVIALGTRLTNQAYANELSKHGGKLIELSAAAYKIIDRAVLASISNSREAHLASADEMQTLIINEIQRAHPNATVLEACTDFQFDLGSNSLHNTARWILRDTYFDLLNDLKREGAIPAI